MAEILDSPDAFRGSQHKMSLFYEFQPQGDDVEERSVFLTELDASLTENDIIIYCNISRYYPSSIAIYYERQIAHIIFPYPDSKLSGIMCISTITLTLMLPN